MCLFVMSLPVASAAPDAPEGPVCMPLGETIKCASDTVVGVITGSTAFVLCLLTAPPTSYPNGLTFCFRHIISAEAEALP